MAKTENEISLVWKVKGENELASAIRSIGNAIKSIDFDKLSEVTGVASILSTLQSNKFYFDEYHTSLKEAFDIIANNLNI